MLMHISCEKHVDFFVEKIVFYFFLPCAILAVNTPQGPFLCLRDSFYKPD